MTDRQSLALARFLAACTVAGLLADGYAFIGAATEADLTLFLRLTTLDIPGIDATFGFMPDFMRVHVREAAASLGWCLALVPLGLLAFRGVIARTGLAVLAAGYAALGFSALRPLTARLLDLFGYAPAGIVAVGDPAGGRSVVTAFLGDDWDGLAGLAAYPVRALVVAAALWLLWGLSRFGR